jgi:Holliday junction resolvase
MAMTPEKRVKNKVVELLKQYGIYYFYPVSGGFGKSGVPDIICCHKGKFVGIEVKSDMKKNRPTALQEKHLSEIRACGGVALVIDAHNLDTLDEILRGLQ